MYEGGDRKQRAMPHEQPRGLECKSRCKTREHDPRRKHRMSREPPGYYFGKRVLLPECSCRWPSLERRVLHHLNFSHGLHQHGCWIFLRGQDYVLLHKTTTGASRTKRRNHPTSRPPIKSTGLEFELTKRTVPR